MFCKKCGAQIPDGATACPNCGNPILMAQTGAPDSIPPRNMLATWLLRIAAALVILNPARLQIETSVDWINSGGNISITLIQFLLSGCFLLLFGLGSIAVSFRIQNGNVTYAYQTMACGIIGILLLFLSGLANGAAYGLAIGYSLICAVALTYFASPAIGN